MPSIHRRRMRPRIKAMMSMGDHEPKVRCGRSYTPIRLFVVL
jgi:hypothetical protein